VFALIANPIFELHQRAGNDAFSYHAAVPFGTRKRLWQPVPSICRRRRGGAAIRDLLEDAAGSVNARYGRRCYQGEPGKTIGRFIEPRQNSFWKNSEIHLQ
jgi:hypothetical protein